MDELPSEYSYIHVPDNKYICFRIKELKDKESVEAWVNKYSDKTKTTWRKRRTFPNSGKLNLYKIEYRCCHNTDRRAKGTGPSKHTGCAAKLVVTINRFIENSKDKAANMKLIESHPCVVLLHNEHNHDLNSAESLKCRDLLPAVKEQLIGLFYKGHGPSSALKTYQTGLMSDLGDQYYIAEADGGTMPTYSVVHKLFESVFPRQSNTHKENRTVIETLPSSSNAFDCKVDEVCDRVVGFCNKLIENVRENTEVFLPAVEKMLDNSDRLTDTDFLTAIYIFGNYSGITQKASKTILRRCQKPAIGVQPAAIAQRNGCLPGNKRIGADKPQDQTTNTSAPNRKRKDSNDFQTCL